MNTDREVSRHYSGGNLLSRLNAALAEDGIDPDHPSMEALAPYDQFHGRGLEATMEVANLVRVTASDRILDIGSGIGGPARYFANRFGCLVTGIDLTPELLVRAKENSELAKVEVQWQEGDVEQMPFGDASFYFVVSQFGHMFAPRPDVAVREMLRVLRPGGTLAFSTWPPEFYTGRLFALVGQYSPPLSREVSSPREWGNPGTIRERLGAPVKSIVFDHAIMKTPGLSPAHIRLLTERSLGPVIDVVKSLANDPSKLLQFRRELEENIHLYFEDNFLRQDFLLTRAVKV